ncbi:MAG: transposase family protein, partial [Verrucomicrobia bacterium]|nr:transposase family protein [Verrucomicrobiota bacterium]
MAKLVDVGSVGAFFESLSDPRHTRNRKHLLGDIIVISVCGILGGCSGPTAIHRWSTLQKDWLQKHLS